MMFFSRVSRAELTAMSETQMKTATGQAGFTEFTMSNNTARLFLDIHMETYATITGLSSGGYEGGSGTGWDIRWNTITVGHSVDDPLTIDGLVMIADFDDTSVANPVLERIVIGSNRLQGLLSADMASYSGMYNDALVGGSGSPVTGLDRSNLGQTTFTFDSDSSQTSDMGLFFILTMDGAKAGLQVVAGYDENTVTAMSPGEWWDSP